MIPGEVARIDGYTTTDGDTIRAFLSVEETEGERRTPAGWLVQEVRRWRTDRIVHPRGIPIRLITLDTPEDEDDPEEWRRARQDLGDWWGRWKRLGVETWPDGGFSRLLGDVFVWERRDLTASAYMLERGWPPYLTKAQKSAPRLLS